MYRYIVTLFLALLLSMVSQASNPDEAVVNPQWKTHGTEGPVVKLWFFWSSKCPHCREAHPAIGQLEKELPWIQLYDLRLDGFPQHIATYRELARSIGQDARSVPAFIFCNRMLVGWDSGGVVEQSIREGLLSCRNDGLGPGEEQLQPLVLPIFGEIDPGEWSLPAFTVVIAALDSFNPCAFFVLLFLLSLLVHAGSRSRMLLIGGLFILISGAVYFVAMSAWLNVFTLVGHLSVITLVAGLLAVVISLFNIKDYFWFKKGASLSISERNRKELMRRMRLLLATGSLPAMLAATFTLAIVANLYELLCTAGFPMVYTRLLTLNNLSTAEYYSYLLLYAIVYIVPLLLIMTLFVTTLGQRKLQENEGRALKLLSGNMMFALGMLLIVAPEALNNILVAVLLLAGSVAATWIILKLFPPGEKSEPGR